MRILALSCLFASIAYAQGFAPFGFQKPIDVTPPPALAGFTAATGATPGLIAITVDFPAVVSDYASVQIRRLAGATAPNVNCSSDGSVIKTYTTPTFPDPDSFSDTGTASSYYSYRACIYDAAGNLTASNTQTNIQAKPSCGGTTSGGYCWYYGSTNQSCTTVCSTHGGHSGHFTANVSECSTVINAIGSGSPGTGDCNGLYGVAGLDCGWSSVYGYGRCNNTATEGAQHSWVRRYCACAY